MFASSLESRAKRRGIVLVVVLGMLGLMALIGVTFATFAGQSLISGRNFSQGVARPQAEALMDYALAQLINDTNNPLSAIRGHSLLRDMYGNDSVFRGTNPVINPAAETGGLLSTVYTGGSYSTLHFTTYQRRTGGNNGASTPFYNQYQYTTNIPTTGQYYGLDFTRWIVRFPYNNANNNVPQTFEILEDDFSGAFHQFTLASNLVNPTNDPTLNANIPSSGDWTPFIYYDPNLGAAVNGGVVSKGYTSLAKEVNVSGLANNNPSSAFVLDGRFMRAFNGAGLTHPDVTGQPANSNTGLYPYNFAAYANFRINGSLLNSNTTFNAVTGDPDSVGMDEDYDACDLENWFLAIQSADGQVVIPSFHRPGILTGPGVGALNDWTVNSPNFPANNAGPWGNPKILRPRQADNSPLFPPDPSIPDPSTGKLNYDIDNDGDGITDSVWVDLGYPVQRDPGGKLYKPLFAFMVLGLNGRLPLNTVGNLQARAIGDQTNTLSTKTGETPPNGTPIGNSSFNSPTATADATTQVPYPGTYTTSSPVDGTYFNPQLSSQVYLDAPLWDHTSHLGYSVNEINPKFALQNAPSNLYPIGNGNVNGVYPFFPFASNTTTANYSQYDNVGVSVALTQLRNILAGTVPTDVQNPVSINNLKNGAVDLTTFPLGTVFQNHDLNVVMVDGNPYVLPNNVLDPGDNIVSNAVSRLVPPIAGRWGEAQGVPQAMYSPAANSALASGISYPMFWYNNPVRAGRSFYNNGTNEAMDDDFDAFDPVLANAQEIPNVSLNSGNPYSFLQDSTSGTADRWHIPLNISGSFNVTAASDFRRNFGPEFADYFDAAGQMGIASERIRRFNRPIDPSGSGRVVSFLNRPNNDHDFGIGFDAKGRVSFYRYFRPAGMPQEIRYPYTASAGSFPYPPFTTNAAAYPSDLGQQYLMPVLLPAGYSTNAATPGSQSDTFNNRYAGYQSSLTPVVIPTGANPAPPQVIASMAPMPYDYDPNSPLMSSAPVQNNVPDGYGNSYNTSGTLVPNSIGLLAPTINPNTSVLLSSINTGWGPNLPISGANPPPPSYVLAYSSTHAAPVVNGYLGSGYNHPIGGGYYVSGGSLNTDEADEMNLYASNLYDQPYGPSDLEWLYRLQDVDGATLTSRLSKLAPVSFLNPADGLTRRRLFSTDSWDLNRFAYANDNPIGFNQSYLPNGLNGQYFHNSRFLPFASPSLENMNQVVAAGTGFNPSFANPVATEFLHNPTFPQQMNNPPNSVTPLNNSIGTVYPNYTSVTNNSPLKLPRVLTPQNANLFSTAVSTATASAGVVVPQMVQVQTPSVAHGDRKINLNFPLPISNDPAEPVRQKWCRETYQLLKAILPPASVDTPEELAALSQFVVNIIDFRDTDCTMTRFVNTDLEVTDVLTKKASNAQSNTLDLTWSVSPAGVRFATTPITTFPYDPAIYSPDGDPTNNNRPTPFLVQHGMEYNPIAINEVMAYKVPYNTIASPTPNQNNVQTTSTYNAFFVELVNTLTEEVNHGGLTTNASAISLLGWDIIVTPDDFGWGRPDPISGDVSQIALPPWNTLATGSPTLPPTPFSTTNMTSQKPYATTTDQNLKDLYSSVQQFIFTTTQTIPTPATLPDPIITAIGASGNPNPFIIGDYRDTTKNGDPTTNQSGIGPFTSPTVGWATPNSGAFENNPVVTTNNTQPGTPPAPTMNVKFPTTFALPSPTIPGSSPLSPGRYYWVYLRRPANPFDVTPANQVRPNKEMVVVDAMRFAAIDAGQATYSTDMAGKPTVTSPAPNQIYSYQRLQPYRGGHLVRTDTRPPSGLTTDMTSPVYGVQTICPPSPPYAYGYSEQISFPQNAGATTTGNFSYTTPAPTNPLPATTSYFKDSINNNSNSITDSAWSHIAFNDRDFTSVAELLLVPGCPPGLFTKQLIDEQYPGNIFADRMTPPTTTAQGTDDRDLTTANLSYANSQTNGMGPLSTNYPNPSVWGRKDFNASGTTLPNPSYPYLPDNFYYTAASVAPPASGSLDTNYTALTTEIGGWTGAGWHKMLEFFEVPSSANGAIGTADGGNNYDWARNDLKPGLLNLNLIIDDEVFAGLVDDSRMNEILAYNSSSIPAVVNQIDGNGYPLYDSNPTSTTYGKVIGAQPVFSTLSTNPTNAAVPALVPAGRGYVVRDSSVADYPGQQNATSFPPQQLHGMKAAFADFLKLRHGGSGFLFAFGNGPTGSGDYPTAGTYPVLQGSPSLLPFLPLTTATQPVAMERPYRSLSYPDINNTIMRPASLPPSLAVSAAGATPTQQSTPPIPTFGVTQTGNGNALTAGLQGLGQYARVTGPPYVQFQPAIAPMNQALSSVAGSVPFQYVFDPGLKNPFLPVQFVNKTAPQNNPTQSLPLAPPYDTAPLTTAPYPLPTTATAPYPPAAPFPPPIPPTPALRLFEVPDVLQTAAPYTYSSNASVLSQVDIAAYTADVVNLNATDAQLAMEYTINRPTVPQQLSTGVGHAGAGYVIPTPPTLVPASRYIFLPDNYTPGVDKSIGTTVPNSQVNNHLGSGVTGAGVPNDRRQHPLYRTEWLQKVMNLTTVRTHQFAVWITVGFFEVVRPGTPELGVPDVLGAELGQAAGTNVRFRSFFTLDRTKATGFNPYYPGNFRDVVTYRRRIE